MCKFIIIIPAVYEIRFRLKTLFSQKEKDWNLEVAPRGLIDEIFFRLPFMLYRINSLEMSGDHSK